MDHQDAWYVSGIFRAACRQIPRATSTGISHVAKHHSTTARPATSPRVTSTMGALSISTINAPATTEMAREPMATQYGGSIFSGVSGYTSKRRDRNTAHAA